MPTMREMSEAHLTNVRNQVTMLREQQQKLVTEIENLETYLDQGRQEVEFGQLEGNSEVHVPSSSAGMSSADNQQVF